MNFWIIFVSKLAYARAVGDMLKLAEWVRGLEGGVWINLGSAVIMPEVFVKALTMARNLDSGTPRDFTAAMTRMRRLRAGISAVDGAPRFRDLGVDVFLGQGSRDYRRAVARWKQKGAMQRAKKDREAG